MPSGIRATVTVPASVCPVARTAVAADASVVSVARSVPPSPETPSVTEFSIEGGDPPSGDGTDPQSVDVTPVFVHGSVRRYRFVHDGAEDCPCLCLGEFECAIDRYTVRDGDLTLVFHAGDYEQLRDVVGDLRERFPGVDIRRLVRSSPGASSRDSVFVDRGKLTDRQFEILETAYEMGYFRRPRDANATEVAAEFDIDPSTLGEHLAAAQSKLLDDVLDGGS